MKRILSLIILGVFFLVPLAWATGPTMTNTNAFVASFDTGVATQTANPGTYGTVYTSETTGGQMSRVTSLIVTNTDTTTAHIVTCKVTNGGTAYLVWPTSVAIPAQTTGLVPPVDMLAAAVLPGLDIDNNGNRYLNLHNGDILACTYTTALSNGAIDEYAQIQNF